MVNSAFKKINDYINNSLDLQVDFSTLYENLLYPLKSIVDYDEISLFFLNPQGISLKFSTQNTFDENYSFDEKIMKKLFSTKNLLLDNSNLFSKSLNITSKSIVIAKLMLKDTVYAILVLAKSEKNFYDNNSLDLISGVTPVVSYKIKDIELSEIFNSQIHALQEGVIETKDAYKTIKAQNKKIVELDKVKNEFLANVTHELRTPLNAIIGFSEMLSTKLFGELNDKQLEYVNDIYISGVHLLGMINEILDISKVESNNMSIVRTKFELSRAVVEVINVMKPLAIKKSIKLDCDISKDRLVEADFQKIKQILYNLISNAIKFTPEKGSVHVSINYDKKHFYLVVSDTGIGISDKDKDKIFDKFVQLNTYTKTESSTGLGLTITKNFVNMHNGQILLETKPNKGSTFAVKIPF